MPSLNLFIFYFDDLTKGAFSSFRWAGFKFGVFIPFRGHSHFWRLRFWFHPPHLFLVLLLAVTLDGLPYFSSSCPV